MQLQDLRRCGSEFRQAEMVAVAGDEARPSQLHQRSVGELRADQTEAAERHAVAAERGVDGEGIGGEGEAGCGSGMRRWVSGATRSSQGRKDIQLALKRS